MYRLFLGFLLSTILLSSCSSSLVFEEYKAIDNGWLYEQPVTFEIDIEDKDVPYDIYVNVRHTNDYEFSNLWVQLNSMSPDSSQATEKFNLILAEVDGKWLGNSWGSIITQERLVKKAVKFANTGKHYFTIGHDMRLNKVPSITHVGIRLEKSQAVEN